MKLFEILDKSLEYEWEYDGPDEKVAGFTTPDGMQYRAGFDKMNPLSEPREDIWEMSFSMRNADFGKGSSITNTGNEFLVFATIRKMIEEFIASAKPKTIWFTAKEPSRVKLYDKFALLFKRAGWSLESETPQSGIHSGEKLYFFTRSD